MDLKFVGRKEELDTIRENLKSASEGKGGLVVIQSEAGLGKTAFMDAVSSIASELNMEVFRGTCQKDANFHPIIDAFESSGGIVHVFIFYKDGRLISCNMNEHFTEGVTSLEEITDEVKNAVKANVEDKEILGLGFPMRIIIERGDFLTLGVTFTGPTMQVRGIRKRIQKVLFELEEECQDVLQNWDGNMRKIISVVQKTNVLVTQQISIKDILEQKDAQSKYDAIFKLIITESRDEPFLLIIDDFQNADSGTIGLITYLSQKVAYCKMLIILAIRTPAPDEVNALLARIAKEKGVLIIELKRFTINEVKDWLDLNYPNTFPNEFAHELFSESDGNPYIMREIMKSLSVSKKIVKKGPKWTLASEFRLSENLPKIVKDLLESKLKGLTEHEEKVLFYASVIASEPAHTFDFAVLTATLNIDEYKLLDIVDGLASKRLISEIGEGIYKFESEAIRSLLYNRATESKRKSMHREIAEAIEKTFAEKAEFRLAFHYSEGEVPMKALSFNMLAGKYALEKFDYLSALICYERAYKFISNLDESQKGARVQIYSRLGEIYAALGYYDNSIEYLNKALGMSWENADEKEMGRIYWSLAEGLRERGEYENAIENYERSCKIANKFSDIRNLARGYLGLANSHVALGNYREASEYVIKSINEARKISDSETIGKADICLGIMYFMSGDKDKGGYHFDKGIGMLEQVGDQFEVARANYELGLAYKAINDYVTSRNLLMKSAEDFERLRLNHRAEIARNAIE